MSGSSAASMLGGALTGAAAGNFLTRATAWLATIFFILCAALAIVASKTNVAHQQSSLRSEVIQQENAENVSAEVPAQTDVPAEPAKVAE